MNQLKFKSDILNVKLYKYLSAKYCQENKERQQQKATNLSKRHQNLSKEEKEKKQEYCREHYKSLSENEKQRLAEYRK